MDSGWNNQAEQQTAREAPPRSLRGGAARLGASLLGLARTRLELASIEFAEERNRIEQQLVLLVAAAGFLMFGVLFAAVWVIVYFWDTNRLTAIAIVALVFAAAGAALLLVRSKATRSAPTPFSATIAEFERDRAALAGGMDGGPSAPPLP
jgi:uncharacterized membrane protein YqjE